MQAALMEVLWKPIPPPIPQPSPAFPQQRFLAPPVQLLRQRCRQTRRDALPQLQLHAAAVPGPAAQGSGPRGNVERCGQMWRKIWGKKDGIWKSDWKALAENWVLNQKGALFKNQGGEETKQGYLGETIYLYLFVWWKDPQCAWEN